MNETRELTDLSQVDVLAATLDRGVVANRMKAVFGGKNVNVYVAFVPKKNTKTIHWKGAVTWGQSGFIFEARVASSGVLYDIKRPSPEGVLDVEMQKFISEFISKKALPKLKEKIAGKKIAGINHTYPMLQAHKSSAGPSKASEKRVKQYENKGVFDSIFSEFILVHHDQGIRCKGQ